MRWSAAAGRGGSEGPTSLIDPGEAPVVDGSPDGDAPSRAGGEPEGPGSSVEAAPLEGALPDSLRRVWYAGLVLFGLQAVGLIVWSWHLWTHFDLADDMAAFGQAFAQIGSGHLNPVESSFPLHGGWGYPFYQSAFELIMWPLALLYTVTRTTFTLLVVQDLALAGAGLAALRWGLDYLARRWPDYRRGASVVAGGLVVLLLVNPWTYWTAWYDFHFEALAAPFAILAARDGWLARRRAWLWLALLLGCGDVAATYGVAVGLILVLTSSKTRRMGIGMVAVSLGWLLLIGAVHGAKGSNLDAYSYLAGHPVKEGASGMLAILSGLVTHPNRGWSMLDGRWSAIYQYLRGAGVIGVASVIGLVPVVVVLGQNGLNSSPIWVSLYAVFQNVLIVFFMGVGAVSVLTWLVRRRWRVAPLLACAVGVFGLAQACYVSWHVTPTARTAYAFVSGPTASELARVEQAIPPDAEAIVSTGVIGRFAARRQVYPYGLYLNLFSTFPAQHGTPVYFVFVDEYGVTSEPAPSTRTNVRQLESMGAKVIMRTDHVVAVVWHPPPHTTRIHLMG